MTATEYLDTLLAAFSNAFNLTPEETEALAFDENNECFITLDEKYIVALYYEQDSDALLIAIPVAPLPEGETREEILLSLMVGNYAWKLTAGGTLGIDEESGLIVLNYYLPFPIQEAEVFPAIINKLLPVVDYWKNEVSEVTDGDDSGEIVDPSTFIRA